MTQPPLDNEWLIEVESLLDGIAAGKGASTKWLSTEEMEYFEWRADRRKIGISIYFDADIGYSVGPRTPDCPTQTESILDKVASGETVEEILAAQWELLYLFDRARERAVPVHVEVRSVHNILEYTVGSEASARENHINL
jgi:hypothetical protein